MRAISNCRRNGYSEVFKEKPMLRSDGFLRRLFARGASRVILVPGQPPVLEMPDGQRLPIEGVTMTAEMVDFTINSSMDRAQRASWANASSLEWTYTVKDKLISLKAERSAAGATLSAVMTPVASKAAIAPAIHSKAATAPSRRFLTKPSRVELYFVASLFLGIFVFIGFEYFQDLQDKKINSENAAQQAVIANQQAAAAKKIRDQQDAEFQALSPATHLELAKKGLEAGDDQAFYKNIAAVPKDAPGRQALIEMRPKIEAEHQAVEAKAYALKQVEDWKANAGSRKEFASMLEGNYLSGGYNAKVSAQGPFASVLRIEWAAADRVEAHKMDEDGSIENFQQQGFRKVILTDGYNYSCVWNMKNY